MLDSRGCDVQTVCQFITWKLILSVYLRMLLIWTYRNNWLAVLCPLTAITSCIFMSLSNILEIASWRRSWKVRLVIFARFLSLSQAWRKATSVMGKGRSSYLDAALNFETASSLNGTHLDEPFFVMGRNAVLWWFGVMALCGFRLFSNTPDINFALNGTCQGVPF